VGQKFRKAQLQTGAAALCIYPQVLHRGGINFGKGVLGMGKRGPSPKPTSLKVLQGNPGKRKINKSEPKPHMAD
jgi:hypothetical protein